MKKYRVVAISPIMDMEMNTISPYEAIELYDQLKSKGFYNKVYVMDNETGELYAHWDRVTEGGGVTTTEWFQMGGDL